MRYLFDIDPGFIRILMKGGTDWSTISKVHELCPAADISIRWWDIDDGGEPQKLEKLKDPNGSASRDTLEMWNRYFDMEVMAEGHPWPDRHQIWFNTMNEPPIWTDLRDDIAINNKHMVEYMRDINGEVHMMTGEINVGHPAEWPPQWEWYSEVFEAINRCGGALALHEYWQQEGPFHEWDEGRRKDWGALAGRYQHLHANVPIYITECGVDGRIFNRHQAPETGWQKFMRADEYAKQVGQYLTAIGSDPRIKWATPFLTDYQDAQWWSFDTLPAHVELDSMVTFVEGADIQVKPITTVLPQIKNGTTTTTGNKAVTLSNGLIDPAVAMAILDVESGGEDSLADGLKIRFEAHIFEKYVDKTVFDTYFKYNPSNILEAYYRASPNHAWQMYHTGRQQDEYVAFHIAEVLDREAAAKSTSMGMAQVMGFNHARIGYPSAQAMVEAFANNNATHLIAFFNFILSDPELHKAVQNKDWREIARRYNGSGFVDMYSQRLEKAYKARGGT
jgi:hypothetical protein